MLTIILLVINIIVCILLVTAVLMQKSEGGALGMGGGPSGFMSARGTGDFLTRLTWIFFSIFLVISIALTLLAAADRGGTTAGEGLRVDPAELLRQEQQLRREQQQQAPGGLQAPAPEVGVPTEVPATGAAPLAGPQAAPAPAPEKK
jgi:preprotein translocase subunit SecG